jgi:diacylglycerol kinase (ATP)
MNPKKPSSEIVRLIRAFGYSCEGLRAAFRQPAFRVEMFAAIILIPAALLLNDHAVERALLIGSVLLVLIVELLNTGIEAAIDRISLERHPLSKVAKDAGSAAVLLSLINAGILWLLILLS